MQVVADHDNAKLSDATLHVVTAASQLGDVSVLVAGQGCGDVAAQASTIHGVASVLVAEHAVRLVAAIIILGVPDVLVPVRRTSTALPRT